MTPLTPQRLAAVYECLRAFPPFSGWDLPHSSQVAFTVNRSKNAQATYEPPNKICISAPFHGHYITLIQSMAHEMIHQHLYQQKCKTWANHGYEFNRKAKTVCRKYGWDYGQFIGG